MTIKYACARLDLLEHPGPREHKHTAQEAHDPLLILHAAVCVRVGGKGRRRRSVRRSLSAIHSNTTTHTLTPNTYTPLMLRDDELAEPQEHKRHEEAEDEGQQTAQIMCVCVVWQVSASYKQAACHE